MLLALAAMSSTEQCERPPKSTAADGKPLKPCCACPDTKRVRDQWCVSLTCVFLCVLSKLAALCSIVEKGEENCTALIEAHKASLCGRSSTACTDFVLVWLQACMRAHGFKV